MHDIDSSNSQFSQFLTPATLKKVFAIKDTFVQRSFFKMLASVAQHTPGFPRRDIAKISAVAKEHILEYIDYLKKAMLVVDSVTVIDFMDLLVAASASMALFLLF